MFDKFSFKSAVVAALLAGAFGLAHAGPIFGSDPGANGAIPAASNSVDARNTFLAGLSSHSTESFESFAVGDLGAGTLGVFGGTGNLTQTVNTGPNDPNGRARIEDQRDIVVGDGDPVFQGRFNTSPANGAKNWFETRGVFEVSLGGLYSAFGFFGTDFGDFAGLLSIDLFNGNGADPVQSIGSIGNFAGVNGSLLFFGYIADDFTFDRIRFNVRQTKTDPNDWDRLGFDDLIIGKRITGGDVPEPGSLALAGLALLGLGATRARRRR